MPFFLNYGDMHKKKMHKKMIFPVAIYISYFKLIVWAVLGNG